MKWKEQFQEFVYSLSTNDKYAEYDSRKSFNRVNNPETEQLYSANNQSSVGLTSGGRDSADTEGHDEIPLSAGVSAANKGTHEVRLAWRHIHQWLDKNTPELYSSLQSPCTDSDVNDFQKDLNITLPTCVIEFFKLTDGQSSYNENGSGGLLFGLKLLPLEEIMILTEHWRKVAKTLKEEEVQRSRASRVSKLSKLDSIHGDDTNIEGGEIGGGGGGRKSSHGTTTFIDTSPDFGNNYSSRNNSAHSLILSAGGSSSITTAGSSSSSSNKPVHRSNSISQNSVVPKQKSIPPGRIHPDYAHPLWIPIFTDEVGNCVGVDLCPPNQENWGQVILFGRDFDTKYVVAENFGDFMLIFANDLEMGNWEIKKTYDETNFGNLMIGNDGEFVFVDRQDTKMEVNYFDILKKRSIEKWISESPESDSEEVRTVVQSIKAESKHSVSLKNSKTIDDFINTNLTSIDKLNTPINENRNGLRGLSSRNNSQKKLSPLSSVTEISSSKTDAKANGEVEVEALDTVTEVSNTDGKLSNVPI